MTGNDEGDPGRDGEPEKILGPSGSSRLSLNDLALQTKLFPSFRHT